MQENVRLAKDKDYARRIHTSDPTTISGFNQSRPITNHGPVGDARAGGFSQS